MAVLSCDQKQNISPSSALGCSSTFTVFIGFRAENIMFVASTEFLGTNTTLLLVYLGLERLADGLNDMGRSAMLVLNVKHNEQTSLRAFMLEGAIPGLSHKRVGCCKSKLSIPLSLLSREIFLRNSIFTH